MDVVKSALGFQSCSTGHIAAELAFFLFKTGDAMLEPSVRLFIYKAVCKREFPTNTTCNSLSEYPSEEQHVQALGASYIMYYKILVNLPAIMLGLFCGAWSDRVGRKLPILLTCFGTIIAVIVYMSSMVTGSVTPFLPLVLVGAAIRGAFGKSAVITMALHSYVSDISTKEERTQKIGKLLAMNYFGYFVGSMLAGAILEKGGFDVVFCTVAFINAACIAVVLFPMTESVPDAISETDRTSASFTPTRPKRSPFRLSHVYESLHVLMRPRQYRGRCHLAMLFTVIIIQQICKSGEVDVTLLFVQRAPLSWPKPFYGYLLAIDYACLGLAVFLLLPCLIRLFHLTDGSLVLIGIAFKILRLLLLGFGSTTSLVYLSVIVGCPSGMIISGAKSLISKGVEEDEMGKAFSLLSCGETISNLLGSIIFTSLYATTLSFFPGFIFTLDAGFFICLFVFMFFLSLDMQVTAQYRLLAGVVSGEGRKYGTDSIAKERSDYIPTDVFRTIFDDSDTEEDLRKARPLETISEASLPTSEYEE